MAGSFRMQPPLLKGTEVRVETIEPFLNKQRVSQLEYETGRLQISTDRSEILIDAESGDPDTLLVTYSIEDSSSITVEEPWSIWTDALAYMPPPLYNEKRNIATTTRNDVIRPDNYRALIGQLFDAMTGEKYGDEILKLPGYPLPDIPEYARVPYPVDGLGPAFTESCNNGGSAEFRHYRYGYRQTTSGFNMTFSDCTHDGVQYLGEFRTRNFGNFRYGSQDGLTVEGQGYLQHLSGSLNYKHTTNRDGSPSVNYSFNGSYEKISQTSDGGDFAVQDASLFTYQVPRLRYQMNGAFYLRDSATEGELLRVEFANPFVYNQIFFPLS